VYWVNVDPPVQIWGLVADVQYKEQQLIESNRILLYTVNILLSKSHLRRGGTKASARFFTRAGARETPPHPYGMAQT